MSADDETVTVHLDNSTGRFTPSTSARLRQVEAENEHLRGDFVRLRASLAASQADLTRVEQERDEALAAQRFAEGKLSAVREQLATARDAATIYRREWLRVAQAGTEAHSDTEEKSMTIPDPMISAAAEAIWPELPSGVQDSYEQPDNTRQWVAAGVAAALRVMADEVDRGPTFPLPPSVISALIRERADRLEGTDG